ncbi:MAG: glycosyltransferase [Mucilaginibacter polytrichastri]|nr:glycosyltransferase [Mucilaginibacter polytrichastri]
MHPLIPYFLIALLQICLVFQFYYLIRYDLRLANYPVDDVLPEAGVPVSVIICARNEESNLRLFLPQILAQHYPDFEVVVVNDHSTDDTPFVLKEFARQYANLKIVNIDGQYQRGKKYAVTMGIKAARNEHLLFTDADCAPASENWLLQMQACFTSGKEIVLGYSPYTRYGGVLNAFIRFETVKTATAYLSSALTGDAFMGIGRNMGYTKRLFFRGKGFASHMHIPSGDDDLFVNENATPENTVIRINPNAHTLSEPKRSFGAFYRQKTRHSRAGVLYKARHRRRLSMQALSGTLFYFILITLLAFKIEPVLVLGLFLLRLVIQWIIYKPVFSKLRAGDLVIWLPLLDVLYYIYLNIFGCIGLFSKSKRWK